MNSEKEKQNEKSNEFETNSLDKLRGDVIGNTMYTQRFVLKTILKLQTIEWNQELEEDLCFLWDSTIEKDVCEYLMEINFPSIVTGVIVEHSTIEYGRLIEILVGIVANIITAKCSKQLEIREVDAILELLTSTDPLVLIQVMRFFIAFCYNARELVCFQNRSEFIFNSVKFILESSTNFELIQKSLETLAKMTENSKTEFFFENEMMKVAIHGCVRSVTEDEEKDFELFTSEQRSCVKYLIEYILNYCVYLNLECNNSILIKFIGDGCNYVDFFSKICKWYTVQENLLPITDELLFYFEASSYILSTLKVDYSSEIFKCMFLILKILLKSKCEEVNEFIEIFCYFVQKGESEQIKLDSKVIPEHDVTKICKFIEKQKINYNLQSDKFEGI